MCDECGKEGRLHVITKKVPKAKGFRSTKDEYGNPGMELIKGRRINPNKPKSYFHLMSYIYGADEESLDRIIKERPVLCRVDNSDADAEIKKIDDETTELMLEIMLVNLASVCAVQDILRSVIKSGTYPINLALILFRNIINGLGMENELWASITDDRWKRSLIEWWVIVSSAEKTSASSAARKYYGSLPDGKRTHLRSKHIQQKKQKVMAFWDKFQEYYPAYIRTRDILMDIISNDQELLYEYQRSMESHKNQIEATWERTEEKAQENLKETETTKYTIRYYFSIRHPYDPQLYAIQASKYKLDPTASPKPTGREEHKLHRSKVPRSIIEDLEKRST